MTPGFMATSLTQPNVPATEMTIFCPIATYFLMLEEINCRQREFTIFTSDNPLGAIFISMEN
uniref:Uncharacterized protein n=1 Tax=Nelumbo nucifera TaxID=4432 RepID=A0A822XTN7_NELNU|nr:TPA_asm: hypothetical protein HUJ06_023648 [Nelumbo nucifera]